MVGIWDAETRLSITACAGADGNEMAETLAALKTVALKGCTVAGDALHCHPAMTRMVRGQGGHYLLKLKGNHGALLAAVETAFAAAEAGGTGPPRNWGSSGDRPWRGYIAGRNLGIHIRGGT